MLICMLFVLSYYIANPPATKKTYHEEMSQFDHLIPHSGENSKSGPVPHRQGTSKSGPVPHRQETTKFGPVPHRQGTSKSGPVPHRQETTKFGPVPHRQGTSKSGPVPHRQETTKSGPVPHRQETTKSGPVPHRQETSKSGPVPHRQETTKSGPVPHRQETTKSGPVPHRQETSKSGPVPHRQETTKSGPVPHRQETSKSGPVPHRQETTKSGPVPHRQETSKSGPVPHRQETTKSGPVPHRQETSKSGPVPHRQETTKSGPVPHSMETSPSGCLVSHPQEKLKSWVKFLPCPLLMADKEILESTGWLNDRIINASQKMLQLQATHIKGWQSTLYQQNSAKFELIDKEEDFVQIVHVRNNHWITVSNIGCDVSVVNIYDSYANSVSIQTKKDICSFWRSSMNFATFRLVNFQRQLNTKDCGLFAIAVAAELVGNTGNPLLRDVHWDVKKFRSHLTSCLESQHISRFPKKEIDRLRCVSSTMEQFRYLRKEKLFCVCKMPNDRSMPMIQCNHCKEWFHEKCIKIDLARLDSQVWNCDSCDKVCS